MGGMWAAAIASAWALVGSLVFPAAEAGQNATQNFG